jgi:hypothetical protein
MCWTFSQISLAHAETTEDDKRQVVELSRTAAVAFDKGEYTKSLSLYERAYSLWPNASLSFAIARCLEAMGKYQEALQVVRRGLTEQPEPTLESRLKSKIDFLEKKLSTGTLILLISPSGAEIKIDGKKVGIAPLETLALNAGKHNIEISYPNYAKIVQGITIQGGAELRLSFTLQPLTGNLSVSSNPLGAEVEINGKPWGKTPLKNLKIPIGSHLVQIRYPGYRPTTKRINISPQQSENISVVLSELAQTTAPSITGAWYKSWPGWTTLILGVGAGVTGGILLGISNQTYQQVQRSINDPNSTSLSQKNLDQQWNQAISQEQVGYILVGAAGGVLVMSAILFATRVGSGKQQQKPARSGGAMLHQTHSSKPLVGTREVLLSVD